jgi:STE24 endopeptidase
MNESKASRYQRLKRRAQAVAVVSGGLMLVLLVATPASRWLASMAGQLADGLPWPFRTLVALATFVLCAVLLWEIVALPAVLYLGLVVDRRFTRADASVEGILFAQAQATVVGLVGALTAAVIVTTSARLAGPWWWLAAGGALAGAQAAALRFAPAVLMRLGDARPVENRALREQLVRLAERARVPVRGIDEWHAGESARATALVTGLGRSRRVFVSAELFRDWTDDEIAVVVAHELAHHAHHDLMRTLALDAAVLAAALGSAHLVLGPAARPLAIAGPGDLAALPLVALIAGGTWLAASPIRHAESRRQERRADEFALALTGGVDAFMAAIRRLGARHLSEERPSRITRWLYYRHPSVAERLALAEGFRHARG